MNKKSIAMGAAFLTVVLGGCSGEPDNVLHSCQEGSRSARVIADHEDIEGQTRPFVSVLLFLRQGTIGSAASRDPIYRGERYVHPTPAKILEQQAVAEAYCAKGIIPQP